MEAAGEQCVLKKSIDCKDAASLFCQTSIEQMLSEG
jgi:hypothetical protein